MGKVRLNTSIVSHTGPTGGVFFTLNVEILPEPNQGFDVSVLNMSPTACLVYRHNPEGVDDFVDVCNINQFLTYTTDSTKEFYRKSVFSKDYSDYNTPVADQTEMLEKITTFYNNLNAYVNSYADSTQTTKSFIVPDYTNDKLNHLIGRWRSISVALQESQAELEVKEKVYHPTLESLNDMANSIGEAIDELDTAKEDYAKVYADADSGVSGLTAVVDKADEIESVSSTAETYQSNVSSSLTSATQQLMNLFGSITAGDEALNAQITNQKALVNNAMIKCQEWNNANKQKVYEIKNLALETRFAVRPICIKLRQVAQDLFSPSDTIDGLRTAMQTLLTELKTKKSECESDIEKLKGLIEEQKSALQLLETQMKQIRPSIDLAHPDSAWYFTVNIS